MIGKNRASRTNSCRNISGVDFFGPFFHLTPEFCYVISADGVVVDVNQAALGALGYEKTSLVGRPFEEIFPKGLPLRAQSVITGERTAACCRGEETVVRASSGKMLTVLQSLAVFDGAGHNRFFLLTQQDISGRKSLEKEKDQLTGQLQQAHRLEAIGTLASGIAHDFNNILGVILGFSCLAKEEMADDEQASGYLDHVIIATNRARELVQQILVFSRSGKGEKIAISPRRTVKEVVHLLRAALPATIEIQSNISSHDSVVLMGPTQFHQVLMNLCTNAFHAIGAKEGVLTISLDDVRIDGGNQISDVTPGKYVRLTVRDTGAGMDREVLTRIFEPYFTTKEKGEGTGLGLSVVHGIVRSSGGAVTVWSEPGKGSSFQVYLPRQAVSGVDDGDGAIQPLPTGNESILLVDDEIPLLEAMSLTLKNLGYKVTALGGGVEALKRFAGKPRSFDLVITDVTMPHMTGLELIRRIMAIRPDMPIILCSGYGSWSGELKGELAVVRRFLRKPFNNRELALTVREALEKKE